MKSIRAVGIISSALIAYGISGALADDLDARLASLERENVALKKQLRIEALEKENAALKKRLNVVAQSAPNAPPVRVTLRPAEIEKPPSAFAYAPRANIVKAPNRPSISEPIYIAEMPQWSRAYFGGSFGGAWTRSTVASVEKYTAYFPTNIFPFQINGNTINADSSGNNSTGALLDIFLGTNLVLGSRFVLGGQLEGTVSDVSFNSSGTRTYGYFNSNGPTGQSAIGDFRPHVHSRWMLSALARAGVILDPATLLYAIGGWTGAKFDYQNLTNNTFFEPNEDFWANGISVGGGIERMIGSNWTLRAEYRYTRFWNVGVSNIFNFSSNFPSTQTNSIQASFNNSMQVGRVGISYLLPPI